MLHLLKRKRVVATVGVIASLVVAALAVAYFTSTGSGTSQASVGSATNWTVNVSSATGGPLYPGSGTENLAYTVTNASTGHQQLNSTSVAVAHDVSGNVKDHGTAVSGCLASWFTAVDNPPTLPQNLAGGATSTAGSVDVTMQDSGTAQDNCQSVHPDITVSAG